MSLGDRLDRLAQGTAAQLGRPPGLGVALAIAGVWLVSGLVGGWSGNWALLVLSGASLVTLVPVYLLVHALHRDNQALHRQLDVLLRAHELAQGRLHRFDRLSEADLANLRRAAARPARRYGEDSD